MTLRVAIIGCGKAAENHVSEIKKRRDAVLVGACDYEPLMAEQFSLRHGIVASYTDFSQLLNEQQPDVVHITTPPQSHYSLALKSIEAGCHLLVEKPLADSRNSAAEIVRRAEHEGCKLTVGWTYYFDPVVRSMRELISQGLVGDPVHLDIFQAYDLEGNFGKAVVQDPTHWVHELKGGLLHNNLDHLLSLVVEFITDESPVRSVHAWHSTALPETELIDELRMTLANESTSAQITFSCKARPLGHFATLAGTKSTVRINIANQTLTQDCSSNLPGPVGRLAYGLDQTRQAAFRSLSNCARFVRSDFHALPGLSYLISAFYDSIEHNDDVPIPYEQILRVSAWIDEVVNRIEQTKAVCQ